MIFLVCIVTLTLAMILVILVTLTSFNKLNTYNDGVFFFVKMKPIVSKGIVETKSIKNLYDFM